MQDGARRAAQVAVYQGVAAVPLHTLLGRFKKSFFLHPASFELYGRVGVRRRPRQRSPAQRSCWRRSLLYRAAAHAAPHGTAAARLDACQRRPRVSVGPQVGGCSWHGMRAVAEQAPVGQVGKGALGDMLYSLFFKASVAPTVVPGGPSLG
jgi:hypothetical protein